MMGEDFKSKVESRVRARQRSDHKKKTKNKKQQNQCFPQGRYEDR
jgi:hypothetical protein